MKRGIMRRRSCDTGEQKECSMTTQSIKQGPSLAEKWRSMLTVPAMRYTDGEYYSRRIRHSIFNRQLFGLLAGTLLGLALGVVYVAAILPGTGAMYALILVVSYTVLHYEFYKVPALPQRDFRQFMACSLAYTLTCGLLVSIGRDFGWELGGLLIFLYCYMAPTLAARNRVKSYITSHDKI